MEHNKQNNILHHDYAFGNGFGNNDDTSIYLKGITGGAGGGIGSYITEKVYTFFFGFSVDEHKLHENVIEMNFNDVFSSTEFHKV